MDNSTLQIIIQTTLRLKRQHRKPWRLLRNLPIKIQVDSDPARLASTASLVLITGPNVTAGNPPVFCVGIFWV